MFPSIHNGSKIKSVESLLNTRSALNPSTLCILEALRLCLECNSSIFNNKFYLQTDGTAQSPLVLIVRLLFQCMMRKQWTTHSNLWFGNASVMM